MTEIIQLAAAIEKTGGASPRSNPSRIRTDTIYVVFTTEEETLAAVRVAAGFASAMAVPLTLVHFRVVPYPLPVDAPAGMSPIESERFVDLLHAEGVALRVRVFLCRDGRRVIPLAFRRHSLVVLGGRRSWWPNRSERWRRLLEVAGHLVVLVDPAEHRLRGEGTDA